MDALDDIRAVEHEGLVAAPGKLVVVLKAQVELLERRTHPAVEDDDPLARGSKEIPHQAMLPTLAGTLTRPWQGLDAGVGGQLAP